MLSGQPFTCSRCGRVFRPKGGWHAEFVAGREMTYCDDCWKQVSWQFEPAPVDWKANRKRRRELLRPLSEERVVVIPGTQEWTYIHTFTLRVGSIQFLDAGETFGIFGLPGDLFGSAWIYRCPLRRWPFLVKSFWDFSLGDTALRIPRSQNDSRKLDELRAIIRKTSPTSNPKSFDL